MNFKVLVTASGLGSRLGSITDFTNKSLVRIGTKPAISHIIENYSEDVKFVITLGHFGNHVKSFLELAYPTRSFEFVNIDNYSGKGSSLGYSMLQAKHLLQCPFIFHACDTITKDTIQEPSYNWMAGYSKLESSQYRTLKVRGDEVFKINDKGEINYDFVYVGLAGIKDYALFWSSLEKAYQQDSQNTSLSDCHALANFSKPIKILKLNTWYDIGNTNSLKKAREVLGSNFKILDKVDENIFIFDDYVIKFFHDTVICKNRVKRANFLKGNGPSLLGYSDNFYKYELIEGDVFSKTVTPSSLEYFLNNIQNSLWSQKVVDEFFKDTCHHFYVKKTKSRVKKYLDSTNRSYDTENYINGTLVPPVEALLAKLELQDIYSSVKTYFHGDFILDNIIYNSQGHTLIDWRQDFGGSVEYGDVYYDLSKFNHNLIFNHDIVNKKLYTIEEIENTVNVDILVSKRLLDCQEVFHKFLSDNYYSVKRVKILTAVIWINMAPLHEYPLSKFLFNFGKYNLYRELSNEK